MECNAPSDRYKANAGYRLSTGLLEPCITRHALVLVKRPPLTTSANEHFFLIFSKSTAMALSHSLMGNRPKTYSIDLVLLSSRKPTHLSQQNWWNFETAGTLSFWCENKTCLLALTLCLLGKNFAIEATDFGRPHTSLATGRKLWPCALWRQLNEQTIYRGWNLKEWYKAAVGLLRINICVNVFCSPGLGLTSIGCSRGWRHQQPQSITRWDDVQFIFVVGKQGCKVLQSRSSDVDVCQYGDAEFWNTNGGCSLTSRVRSGPYSFLALAVRKLLMQIDLQMDNRASSCGC